MKKLTLASLAILSLSTTVAGANTSRKMTLQQLAAACAQVNCNPNSVIVDVPVTAQNQNGRQKLAATLSEDDNGETQCHGKGCDAEISNGDF